MPLYLVAYQINWETHVELMRAAVVANDAAAAVHALGTKFNLPIKRMEFKAELIEDGIMSLSKRAVSKEDTGTDASLNNYFEHDREYRPPILQYNCQILAVASGEDDFHALKRVAHAAINKCNQQISDKDRHVIRLMLNAEPRVPGHDKMKPMEALETYKGLGIIRK